MSSTCRAIAVLLFLCPVLLFFAPSFQNYFVSDDYEFLGRINFHNAGEYFTKSWGYGNEYRPLLVFTYALNGTVSGFNPAGYHIFNTVVHALNALVLALILELLAFSSLAALLAATIFVLNPVTHESVLWIAGRPVLLCTLFALLSVWCFLNAVSNSKWTASYWIGAYLTFVFALHTYEAAVVVPFLMLLLGRAPAIACSYRRYSKQITGLFCILLAYLMLWNFLFGLRITRFPIEHSAGGAAASLACAMTNSFHGSRRLWAAPLYIALLWLAFRSPRGRSVLAHASGWFLVAFAPFLLVHGYADRFSYLASAAVATVIAAGLMAIYRRSAWTGRAAAATFVLFFAIGMQNRITTWRQAGEIARQIVIDVKQARPTLPQDATVILLNAPSTYKQALVFITGLERAVALQYPHTRVLILRQAWSDLPKPIVEFAYRDGHMRETGFPL